MLKGLVRLGIAVFALIFGVNLYGASIGQDTALGFAESWLSSQGNPVVADGVAREISGVVPVEAEGVTYGYAVNFAPEGFMVVSSDDRINPVLYYNGTGSYVASPENPLFWLIVADMEVRLSVAEEEAPEGETRGAEELPEYYQGARDEWGRYLNAGETRAWQTATIEDIWVDSFVTTQWGQNTIFDADSGNIYAVFNYYTPTPTPNGPEFQEGNPNNSVTGCVATAFAQILKYYEWPQGRVNFSNGVSVGDKSNMMQQTYYLTLDSMGGDGMGGPYNWSLMIDKPGAKRTDPKFQEASDENYRMIGRLLRDAGVAVGMNYYHTNAGESGSNFSAAGFRRFGYTTNSVAGGTSKMDIVRANLDARRPLPISIWAAINLGSASSGHAIFIDGYGTHNGRWFYHMNMGWNGGSDGWYNFDEHFASAWNRNISVNCPNVYRNMTLQDHEDLDGSILSGRVTDANGVPVAGVKASIRKKGMTETWQTMAAWYDRLDGIDCHTAVKKDGVGYGANNYRNTTDGKGIWAIDKVESGTYEIVLEKEGYVFLGVNEVTTSGRANNKWGLNFIAVPESIGHLTLENWWIEGTLVTLKFNRPIGGVALDTSKITLSSGGSNYSLAGCFFSYAAESDTILIDIQTLGALADATLTMKPGFLYYDVDGTSDRKDVYNVPTISVGPAITNQPQGTVVPPGVVTAITRDGNDFLATGSELTFKVTSSGNVDVNDFRVSVTPSYQGVEGSYGSVRGTLLPPVSIGTLEAGLLHVNVGDGYGFVRVDYIPADGKAFMGGETYLVDKSAPAIVAAKIETLDERQYVTLTFNKPVGGADKISSIAGVNVASDGNVYRYAETAENGLVVFRKGASDTPDGVYNSAYDEYLWGSDIPEGTAAAGSFGDIGNNGKVETRVKYIIVDEKGEAGRLRWIDIDGDGQYTHGVDGFIMQWCNEIAGINGRKQSDFYSISGISVSFHPTYGPDLLTADEITEVHYTDQQTPASYGHIWLGPGVAPTGTFALKHFDDIPLAERQKIAYYSNTGIPFPSETIINNGTSPDPNKLALIKEFFSSWTAAGSGAWTDKSVDNSNEYVAGQDELLMGKGVADGFVGAPLTTAARLFYIDLDQSGSFNGNDFVWRDGNNDGAWSNPSNAADELLSNTPPSQLNWRRALSKDDLQVVLYRNGGTASNVRIDQVTAEDGSPLTNASAVIRARLDITPKMTQTSTQPIPSGVETIEVRPREGCVYDASDNVASSSSTSGELPLSAIGGLFLSKAKLSPDNGAIALRFSKRVVGNPRGGAAANLKNIVEDERYIDETEPVLKSTISSKNFTVTAFYNDGTSDILTIADAGSTGHYGAGIFHREGSNYVVINLLGRDNIDANLPKLAPKDKALKSIRVDFKDIYDYNGDKLATAGIGLDANPVFSPGKASLPPPVFSTKKNSYTFIHAPGCENGNPTFTYEQVIGHYDDDANAYVPGIYGQAPYVWTAYAEKDGVATYAFQHDLINTDDEAGVESGEMYLGMYYRDLDADGRIDAVDMNFFNPWGEDEYYPAELVVGPNAKENFLVWVHSDDCDNITYNQGAEGIAWNALPGLDKYPLNNATKDADLYNLMQGVSDPKGWRRVDVKDISIIQQNANHATLGNGGGWKPGDKDFVYSTVRITIDPTNVSPRTFGDRQVLVTYVNPRNTYGKTYDGLVVKGINTTPKEPGSKQEIGYKYIDADGKEQSGKHTAIVNAAWQGKTFSNDDEEAGIYWLRKAGLNSETGEDKDEGALDAVWICDSFGPVSAWDGVPPQAVSAIAWRATPYTKALSGDAGSYEFVDVRFSEPILGADDLGLTNEKGEVVSGYSANIDSYVELANGPIGVTMLNDYTVRFRLQTNKNVHDNKFKFRGTLYPVSTVMEHTISPASFHGEYVAFDFTAPAVRAVDSAYNVLGSASDEIDVFEVKNYNDGSVANYRFANTFGTGGFVYFNANVKGNTANLRALPQQLVIVQSDSEEPPVPTQAYGARTQGGNFSSGDATVNFDIEGKWYGDTARMTSGRGYVKASDTSKNPGAGFYATLSSVCIINDNFFNMGLANKWMTPNVGSTTSFYNFPAPASTSYATAAYSSPETPTSMMLSGPLYVYGKAMSVTKEHTTRTNVGEVLTVAGIDAAAPEWARLTGVKVRLVDTSHGAFDPATALKPLADNETSGVLLYDVNAKSYVKLSNDKLEWSELKRTVEGLLYREVTLRPLDGVKLPAKGNGPNTPDFEIRVVPSDEFRSGSSFYAQIPDDGLFIGAYQSSESKPDTWGTPDGTKGYRLTDTRFKDINGDKRWNQGEPLVNCEDSANGDSSYDFRPYLDGGRSVNLYEICRDSFDLQENGINTREIYYAKKNGALNPETTPWNGLFGAGIIAGVNTSGSDYDLEYNVAYQPGDDMWYDVGGTLGVYDEGIDIPIIGNANLFALPWAVEEFGTRSAQFRAAAPAATGDVSTGSFATPSVDPIPILAVNMQDSSRAFGPRYVLDGAILVESISKDMAAGTYELAYDSAAGKLSLNGGAAVAVPAKVGERVILKDSASGSFIVVRRLNAVSDPGEPAVDGPAAMPASDKNVSIVVANEKGREIQQPAAITGVRILAVGTDAEIGESTLTRTGTKLAWNGGASVDASKAGIYVLYGSRKSETNYITVQTSVLGGATSETLMVYGSNGRQITPFRNITGLEIVAVGDMVRQGWYTFSYDNGAISFGNGGSTAVPAVGDVAIVYGDGEATDYSRPYIVVKRTSAALPNGAVSDRLMVNQNSLYWVDVTIRSVNGVTPTHFNPLSKDEDSGVSLWWDADASGTFTAGDMFVPLLETPVFAGGGDVWTCSLVPDPDFMTAWLSTPLDSVFNKNFNFFVCVKTTVDMSFGDSFQMSASFLDPSEPTYDYFNYRRKDKSISFGTDTSRGLKNQITRGDVYSFAQVVSKVNTCTTVTNTVFAKETSSGQTVDADSIVPLTSVSHFIQRSVTGNTPYVTEVSIDLVNVKGFDPATALKSLDNNVAAGERGVILYRDNGDGVFNPATDTVVNSAIKLETTASGVTHITLLLADESCTVPSVNDDKKDLFIALNMADDLLFGVSFYGAMEPEYIIYSTGKGSAASAIRTDILSSTINAEYADLVGVEPFTSTGGLLVQSAGSNVSGYQTVTLSRTLNGAYVLNWNGNQVTITDLRKATTVTIGSGADSITVTFDPVRFFSEDALAYSAFGDAVDANGDTIPLGTKLTSIAGSTTCFYTDVNADGKFTLGIDRINQADSDKSFTAADRLAFYDANENGIWDADEPIFFDTDLTYTLPWMDAVIDTDSTLTQGIGTTTVVLDEENSLDPVEVSPTEGDATVNGRNYLYYVDADDDANRNYNPLQDVVVLRSGTGGMMAPLTLAATDLVVLYPAFDGTEEYDVAANIGATLRPFQAGDRLKMNLVKGSEGAYGQTKALILSDDNTWKDMEMSWQFLVTPARTIRRYTPDSANPAYATYESAMSAIIGLDFANSGASDVILSKVTVNFNNVNGWVATDFLPLSNDKSSGVQLWRDADGNGVFDPEVDTFVPLAGKPSWSQNGNTQVVSLSPSANNEITSAVVDDIHDFFIVVIPSQTANNTQQVNSGDKFVAYITSDGVSLNKTVRKIAGVTTGTIAIDSKPPVLENVDATAVDSRIADTLSMTFDEGMKKLTSSDLSVWNITDTVTGNAYKVTDFVISDDSVTASLKLAPADGKTEADYSTAPVSVAAAFTTGTALVDWANNPAEIKDIKANDKVSPFIRTATLLDTDSDGVLDSVMLTFTEPVLDTTFGTTEWTMDGAPMTLQTPGTSAVGIVDALNDSYLVFKVDASAGEVTPESFAFGEVQTLTDAAGNVLKVNDDFTVVDAMVPILLLAEQEGENIRFDNPGYTLVAGTVIKLTFSEELVSDGAIGGITLVGGGKSVELTDGAEFTAVFDGASVSFTTKTDISGFTTPDGWLVKVNAVNTGIKDVDGNIVAANDGVPMTIYISPELVAPADGVFFTTTAAEPTLVPQIKLNYMASRASSWKIEIFKMDAAHQPTGDALATYEGTLDDINTIDDDAADNIALDGWYDDATIAYVFQATLASTRGDVVLTAGFYAMDTEKAYQGVANRGITMERTGDTSVHKPIFDDSTHHYFLLDGAYTSGRVVVNPSFLDAFTPAVPTGVTRKITFEASNGLTATEEAAAVLDWSDELETTKLAAGDTIVGKVVFSAVDKDGNEVVIANSTTYVYTIQENFDDLAAAVILTDGAYTELAEPVVWNDPTTVYALLAKLDVKEYQWRIIPADGSEGQPWNTSGEMNIARERFGWTKLSDGRILVAGGFANNNPNGLSSTEIFDGATSTWIITGALNVGVYDNAVIALDDGKALSIGGANSAKAQSDAIELYENGTWRVVGALSQPKQMVAAVRAGDKIYVFGGYSKVTKEVDGRMTTTTEYLDTIERIDIAADGSVTTTVEPMKLIFKRGASSAFIQENHIAIVGGNRIDETTGRTVGIPGSEDIPLDASNMLVGDAPGTKPGTTALNAMYVMDDNGVIWEIGGRDSKKVSYLLPGSTSVIWDEAANSLNHLHDGGAAICINGEIIVAGGSSTSGIIPTETLDITTLDGAWVESSDLASSADGNRTSFAIAEVNGSPIAFGGKVNGALTTATESRLASWSKWIATEEPTLPEQKLAFGNLNLAAGKDYFLQVRAKNSADGISDILSTVAFTIGTGETTVEPIAAIEAAIGGTTVASGISTMETAIDFTFVPDANTVSYRYILDSAAAVTTTDTTLALTSVAPGSHTLKLFAMSTSGAIQKTPAVFEWTVTAPASALAIVSDSVTNGGSTVLTDGVIFTLDATGWSKYHYSLDGGALSADADIATGIELSGLETGSHTIQAWVATDEIPFDDANSTTFAFDVIAVGIDPAASTDTTTTRTFTITAVGGTVDKFQWTLDEAAPVVVDPATALLTLDDIPIGAHTLKVAAIDAAGNVQAVPAVASIIVTSSHGDSRLLANLTADAATASIDDGDITFTLAFVDDNGNAVEVAAAPVADDFTVLNGTVTAVASVNESTFTVTVEPAASIAAGETEVVSLQLMAGRVHEPVFGHSNVASATASTLVYSPAAADGKLVSFGIGLYSDFDLTTPVTTVEVLDAFYVAVEVDALRAITGADVKVTYDPAKFALADDTLVATDIVQAPFNAIDTEATGKTVAFVEKKADGEIHLGGAVLDPANAVSGSFDLAILKFKAIGTGDGADTDFAVAPGEQTIGIEGILPIANDDPAVAYGSARLEVTEDVATLAISLVPDTIDEGGATTLTATISGAIATDLTVVVSADDPLVADQTIVIAAGDTTGTKEVIVANDNKLTGDYDITLTVTSTATGDSAVTAPATGAEAVLKVVDLAVEELTFTLVNADGDEIGNVTEGEQFFVRATLGAGNVAAADVKFTLAVGGTAVAGTDYTYANSFVIVKDDVSGTETFTTYRDGALNAAPKTIELTVTALTVEGFTVPITTGTLTMLVYDGDTMRADISGDGVIDGADVLLFLYYYQTENDGSEGWGACDFNGDGVIDGTDALLFLYYYESGDTRGDTREDLPVFDFILSSDKATLGVGEETEVSFVVNFSKDGGINGAQADIAWDPSKLQVVGPLKEDGSLDLDAAINKASFEMSTSTGTLDNEAGKITKFFASTLKPGELVLPVTIGTFTVKALAVGEATISISNPQSTAPGKISYGLLPVPDNATGNITNLTLNITTEPTENGFLLDFHGTYRDTRAPSDVLLTIGEKEGASDAFSAADGDIKAMPGDFPYAFYVKNGSDRLTKDVRALTDSPVTWQCEYAKTDSDQKELELTWDLTGLDAYIFTIEVDGAARTMEKQGSLVLSGNSKSFAVTVQPAASLLSQSYALNEGWNLVGAPFDLDAVAINTLKGEDGVLRGYDADAFAFPEFTGSSLAAGECLWVHRTAPATVEVKGTAPAAEGVQLIAGWNLVTPLATTAASNMTLPNSPRVWVWTADGYRWINEDSDIRKGTGYWFYSETETTIWKTAE